MDLERNPMDKPQPKFKIGDSVRIKDLPYSELCKQSHGWNSKMNNYIRKPLTIASANYSRNTNQNHNGRDRYVWLYTMRENSWVFEEYVLTSSSIIENNQFIWI